MKKVIFILLFIIPIGLLAQGYSTFQNGEIWNDTDDKPINAHGAVIIKYGNTYYMFGEFKGTGENGGLAFDGVSCYSSKDLYNWKNEGIALKVHDDTLSKLQKVVLLKDQKFCIISTLKNL